MTESRITRQRVFDRVTQDQYGPDIDGVSKDDTCSSSSASFIRGSFQQMEGIYKQPTQTGLKQVRIFFIIREKKCLKECIPYCRDGFASLVMKYVNK